MRVAHHARKLDRIDSSGFVQTSQFSGYHFTGHTQNVPAGGGSGPVEGVAAAGSRASVELLSPNVAMTASNLRVVPQSDPVDFFNVYLVVNGATSSLNCSTTVSGCTSSASVPVPANSKLSFFFTFRVGVVPPVDVLTSFEMRQ